MCVRMALAIRRRIGTGMIGTVGIGVSLAILCLLLFHRNGYRHSSPLELPLLFPVDRATQTSYSMPSIVWSRRALLPGIVLLLMTVVNRSVDYRRSYMLSIVLLLPRGQRLQGISELTLVKLSYSSRWTLTIICNLRRWKLYTRTTNRAISFTLTTL